MYVDYGILPFGDLGFLTHIFLGRKSNAEKYLCNLPIINGCTQGKGGENGWSRNPTYTSQRLQAGGQGEMPVLANTTRCCGQPTHLWCPLDHLESIFRPLTSGSCITRPSFCVWLKGCLFLYCERITHPMLS